MAYFQKLKDAVERLFPFLFKKQISAEEFTRCVFVFLKKRITGKGVAQKNLEEIDSKEKNNAHLYLKLEKYISQEQPTDRIPAETLRDMIFRSCHAEWAAGDLSLIFLPGYLRRIRMSERFTDNLLKNAGRFLTGNDYLAILKSVESESYLSGIIKNSAIDWRVFEIGIEGLKFNPEKQEELVKQHLSRLLTRLFKSLTTALETLRAELVFKESYQQFRDSLDFLEDASQVLFIVPAEILQEERVEIMSKMKLAEEVRRRTEELELALSQLSEEKRKLDEERRKLAAALVDLQAVDRAKSEFIDVVSHQFRTPLSAIRWNNELLTEEIFNKVTEEAQEKLLAYTRIIQDKIIFIINILRDVYDVLAIEGRTAKVEKKPSQLWEIIEDVLLTFEKMAKDKKVEIKFDRSIAPLKEILLDQQKINRVFEILIRNAIQYTPENSKVTIALWEAKYQGKPVFACSIQDTGIGITPEDLPRLFTKFFRAKNAITVVADGVGLGLYLAKNFLEIHGGAIWVESELNKGSKFTFILPQT